MELLQEYVSRSVLCWLATVDPSGAPSVSPKEVFGLVDGCLVIANIASPRSAENIRAEARVCVSLLDVFEQQGLRISGRATVHPSTAVDMQAARLLLEGKTAGRFPFAEVFVVEVDDVQPYAAPSWHLFPTMDAAERRAGALRAYGVRELDT